MQTKNIVIIASLTVISLILGMFWVVAPANMKDKVIGFVTSGNTDRQCFNYYKNKKDYFRYPDSAYMESSYIWTKKDELEFNKQFKLGISPYSIFNKYDSVVRIKVRAKNAMGDYASINLECPNWPAHLFDSDSDKVRRSIDMDLYENNVKALNRL